MSGPIREPASAKVNLVLRVLGRRPDGYHEIETVLAPLTLADGVEAAPAEGLSLAVVGPRAAEVPRGEENLVLRAARALAAAAGVEPRARLLLVKQVPVAAGLGGGSADAAAALRALNDVWGCGLSVEDLERVAAEVGSDVPGLVRGGPVLARGRGEQVEDAPLPRLWWVLLPGSPGIASAEAYAWWDEEGETGPPLPDLASLERAEDVAPLLRNDLEPPTLSRRPDVAAARDRLLAAGALAALVSGSGPTVAALCRDGQHAGGLAAATGGIAAATVAARPLGG